MLVLNINEILNRAQIIVNGIKRTCPMKEINGELFFKFKNEWHQVAKYTSELTTRVR